MREIKYRAFGNGGRRKGKWYFGTSQIEKYKGTDNQDSYLSLSAFERLIKGEILIPQTRGQYTEHTDINGVEIYEADYMIDGHSGECGEVKFYKGAFIVEFDNEIQDLHDWTAECVIGNIHENPELSK